MNNFEQSSSVPLSGSSAPPSASQTSDGATPEGMLFQGANGAIQGCNTAAEKILGFTKEQMQGWTFETFPWKTLDRSGLSFPREHYPALVTLRTGQPCLGIVLGLYHPDGKLIWLQINTHPLFQANETAPYAVVSTFTEISASRHPPNAVLHQSQALHEAIFNESTDALFLVDPVTLRTVDCNQRAVELFAANSKTELINIEGPTLHRYPLTPEQRRIIHCCQYANGGLD